MCEMYTSAHDGVVALIEAKGVTAGYAGAPIVRNVELRVKQGDVLALLGRNGVGKTTLLKTLIGLLKPTTGEIFVSGRNVTRFPAHRIAKEGVGYVPQGRGIFPKLTVRENLVTGTRSARSGSRSSNGKDVVESVISRFPALAEKITQQGGSLSGGQQQMLAIARALCGRPRVLLLDEPSEGIQPSIVQEIGELIGNLAATEGLGVILVEQNLDLARRASTRGCFMENGEVVRECSADELSDRDIVSRYMSV